MIDQQNNFSELLNTVTELVRADNQDVFLNLLLNSQASIEQTNYDNWNGGTYGYTVYLLIETQMFVQIATDLETVERLLLEKFSLSTRHLTNESIDRILISPKSSSTKIPLPNPHRPLSANETKRRTELSTFLDKATEDELIGQILLPLFRQLGFHRISSAGHKDKALEYGKDIWMKFTLPTQHVLYFGVQAKKDKLDSSGVTKSGNANVAEIHNQALMMLGHEVFDPEFSRTVLVDHAFIVAGGEITKAARNWLANKLDVSKRSQIIFMDRNDILDLYVVNNLPIPLVAVTQRSLSGDLPF